MSTHDLNVIYKISNTNLFKIQSDEIIDMEVDSVLIEDSNQIDTNLHIYNNIQINEQLSKLIYEYFSNKRKMNINDFIEKIKQNISNDVYIDFSNYPFDENNLKLFKALFIFSISIFNNVCISDEIYNKLNIDNDLHYFIKDLIIFRKYMNDYTHNDIKVLIAKDNILAYQINNVYFLFNINPNPVKFELPISMQNKIYYSIICNNDKHLKDILIIGKNHFFIFEDIE